MKKFKYVKTFEAMFNTPTWLSRESPERLELIKNLGIGNSEYWEYFEKGNYDGPKKPTGKIPSGMSKEEWYDRLRRFMPTTYNIYCEGFKSKMAGLATSIGLLFGSCTWVGIQNDRGEQIENSDYANKTTTGVIKDITRRSKGRLEVEFVDEEGNLIHTSMRPTDFWREDTPSDGDSIKLVFDEEGKNAEVYLKDDYDKSYHRHPGGSFWQ
jgi:hypothetical protein